jgi:hypothetical protein
MIRQIAALGLLIGVSGCAPRLTPLTGAPVPAERLPRSVLSPGHYTLVFDWELDDRGLSGRGDGAARIAAPDSARLDFFLGGNFGGAAILIRDSLDAPGGDMVRRFIPPPTLMWAALGRVALPNLPDTSIRVDGPILRADIGSPVAWRLTFRSDTLIRAERVSGGRVAEWVERSDASHIRYRNEGARRSLQLSITHREEVAGFDASIWRFVR